METETGTIKIKLRVTKTTVEEGFIEVELSRAQFEREGMPRIIEKIEMHLDIGTRVGGMGTFAPLPEFYARIEHKARTI